MRLLVFHPALAPYRVDFFNGLARLFELKVVFQARNLTSQKFDQEKMAELVRFDFDFMKHTRVSSRRKLSLGYARYIREFHPDVVVGSEYGTNVMIPWLIRLFRRDKYKLWTSCDDSVDVAERTSRIRSFLRRFFAPRLDGIIFCNDAVRDWMKERFALRNSAVIPIIADENVLRARLGSVLDGVSALQEQFSLAGRRVILFVGRLNPVKNLHLLLEAMALLPPENTLVLVGSGEEEASLREQAGRLGIGDRVCFAGRFEAPELYLWYQLAVVFVLPSRFEPFGAVTGEALQAGCPVVCSDVAGSASLIREGVNGTVADHTSATSVAGCIAQLLDAFPPNDIHTLRPSLMDITLEQSIQSFKETLE